jgi:ActR/RegA family two-component response regulator
MPYSQEQTPASLLWEQIIMPDANLQLTENKDLSVTPKILIVDDDDLVLETLRHALKRRGFPVVAASNVKDALRYVSSASFDVLVSDLHMPTPGDGLTVVSAMRHFHPQAITILSSAFPEMTVAAKAILRQVDEVLVKPMNVETLIDTITARLERGATPPPVVESVAAILERETQATIEEWLGYVDVDPLLAIVPLDDDKRCGHLPRLFLDLVYRLRHPLPLGRAAIFSPAAAEHGQLCRQQGYTAAMMIEESRLLQVSIFQTLKNNLHKVDFSLLLDGVMAIADEVDSQLAQQMASYVSD